MGNWKKLFAIYKTHLKIKENYDFLTSHSLMHIKHIKVKLFNAGYTVILWFVQFLFCSTIFFKYICDRGADCTLWLDALSSSYYWICVFFFLWFLAKTPAADTLYIYCSSASKTLDIWKDIRNNSVQWKGSGSADQASNWNPLVLILSKNQVARWRSMSTKALWTDRETHCRHGILDQSYGSEKNKLTLQSDQIEMCVS